MVDAHHGPELIPSLPDPAPLAPPTGGGAAAMPAPPGLPTAHEQPMPSPGLPTLPGVSPQPSVPPVEAPVEAPVDGAPVAAPLPTLSVNPIAAPTPTLSEPASEPVSSSGDPVPVDPAPPPTLGDLDVPRLPDTAPSQPAPGAPALAASPPTLVQIPPAPTPADDGATSSTDAPVDDRDGHPMAHMMPVRKAPSEAAQRAAELRAAKKAKSRRVKIGILVGAIIVGAVAGPPLFEWTKDAINEAGSTSE